MRFNVILSDEDIANKLIIHASNNNHSVSTEIYNLLKKEYNTLDGTVVVNGQGIDFGKRGDTIIYFLDIQDMMTDTETRSLINNIKSKLPDKYKHLPIISNRERVILDDLDTLINSRHFGQYNLNEILDMIYTMPEEKLGVSIRSLGDIIKLDAQHSYRQPIDEINHIKKLYLKIKER